MFWAAKGGCIPIGDTDMDYVSFGTGSDILIMLPGLGDGLTTVKGMAVAMAITYRMYAKNYKVFIFSRKNKLNAGYSTRDMAKDQAEAMKALGISKAYVLGVSQGGMIAQYLAIDYPELVEKLVLAVTLLKQNETIQKVVKNWIHLAEQKNVQALIIDTAEKSYSEHYLKRYRVLYPLLGKIGKPKDFSRFHIQALSCIRHDTYEELDRIICPTLVIGGNRDKIVGATASRELAEGIQNSELFLYNDLGHGAYEEAEDFHDRVMDFLSKSR